MLRSPRVWLYAAGGWLLSAGLLHLARHVSIFVLERGIEGQRAFAVGAMKEAFMPEPLEPSMWRVMGALSAGYGLLLGFAGAADLLLAWSDTPRPILAVWALFSTVFWTLAFAPYVFFDPVVQPLVVAAVSVPLHATAWLTATYGGD